jgi:soluble lytic murein transglycosylase-like protein
MHHTANLKPLCRGLGSARWARLLIMLAGFTMAHAAQADCFDQAAAYEHVNPMLLRAIAWQESHNRASATHANNNGTVDYGLMQINSVHMPVLAQYGISLDTLMQPCANVYIGAWHLRRQISRYGATWQAVGAYHSATPALRDQYGQQIYAILANWNQLGGLPPPLPANFSSTAAGIMASPAATAVRPYRHHNVESGVLIYRGTTTDPNRIHRPAQ